MTSVRDLILGKIRRALGMEEGVTSDGILPEECETGSPIPRNYRRRGTRGPGDLLDLLQDRIVDYEATVVRCRPPELSETISLRLEAREAMTVVLPPGIPDTWIRGVSWPGLEIARDLNPETLDVTQLGSAHAVLTGCTLAIAETGTLVLDGGPTQGRRALTLLPDYHLCVVFQHQVVETVPEAVESLTDTKKETRSPLTLISGPSATSDIELIRVEGVHGPRTLDVILVEDR